MHVEICKRLDCVDSSSQWLTLQASGVRLLIVTNQLMLLYGEGFLVLIHRREDLFHSLSGKMELNSVHVHTYRTSAEYHSLMILDNRFALYYYCHLMHV